MTDNWGFYERRTGNDHMRVLVNIGYKAAAPLPDYPELLSVTVNLYPVRAQSRNNRQVIVQLEELESKLETWLSDKADAIYIGRINAATRLEFYYFLKEGRLDGAVFRQWLDENWAHRAQSYIKPDPEWEFYRFLLPTALEELYVHNAQMIYALIHKGDKIGEPRNVYHWLLFREDEDRLEMEDLLQREGYVIEKDKESKPEEDYPYPLVISRYEDVKLDTVNARVRDLHRLLDGVDGRYDGWGSTMRLSNVNRFRRYIRRRKDTAYSALRRMFACGHSQSNQNQAGKH
ncbi:DUF695 domain-containing protein [Paenibacillus sacheonensis]|uniref:DUF695 domain-containing protein n=1 Tax=Paenibacillus sacheonensis TaxID=742054 RepID=A0A7X4YNR6_9BACL|nr:DUF695 domain-containing protein [Paenibacillus sacheonensis]MBM7565320.1 regulator of RNase E activity RraB [Paenibacillus sacheonensis]NBC69748.1 DUF695 domain-containing protein [Paenibacillus sacheonensis]